MNVIVLYHIWKKATLADIAGNPEWLGNADVYTHAFSTTDQGQAFAICKTSSDYFYTFESAYQRDENEYQ